MNKPKFYLVGGSLRDSFLGLKSKDLDYVVVCNSFDEMKQAIIDRGGDIFLETPKYLTIRALIPELGSADFVCARRDGDYSDGRRPDSVEIGSLLDDLSRRDFTVNAIAKDVDTGQVIDPFDGKSDIDNKILRCVGNTKQRFEEDYLRLLRAMRFSITKSFCLSFPIHEALRNEQMIEGLKSVSIERIWEELNKCFTFSTWKTLNFLDDYLALRSFLFKDKNLGIWLKPTLKNS